MNHSNQLKRLVVERELAIDGFDYTSVDSWAAAELATDDHHPHAYDLFERNCDTFGTLKRIANERHGFQMPSADADLIVDQIAHDYLTRFLSREISAVQLCKLVNRIDTYCIDHDHPVPAWVGALYNACDWCDESWTHGSMPHLVEEVETAIEEINQA